MSLLEITLLAIGALVVLSTAIDRHADSLRTRRHEATEAVRRAEQEAECARWAARADDAAA